MNEWLDGKWTVYLLHSIGFQESHLFPQNNEKRAIVTEFRENNFNNYYFKFI